MAAGFYSQYTLAAKAQNFQEDSSRDMGGIGDKAETSDTDEMGWTKRLKSDFNFDPRGVATISGQVVNIGVLEAAKNRAYELVYAIIKDERGEFKNVELGPRWYLKNLPTRIKKGDSVTMVASYAKDSLEPNRSDWIASSILIEGEDYPINLRDPATGCPIWECRYK